MLAGEFDNVKSALNIFVKDMRLVVEAAEDRDFETPLASAAHHAFVQGSSLGFGSEDDSIVVRVFDRRFSKRTS